MTEHVAGPSPIRRRSVAGPSPVHRRPTDDILLKNVQLLQFSASGGWGLRPFHTSEPPEAVNCKGSAILSLRGLETEGVPHV